HCTHHKPLTMHERAAVAVGVSPANGAFGESDIEHVAIGNRAGRRQRSYGSWRELGAMRVIKAKPRWGAARMEPRGRERHRWVKPRGRSGREDMSQSWEAKEVKCRV